MLDAYHTIRFSGRLTFLNLLTVIFFPSQSFLILWIFNWTSTIGWLFSYDREYFGVALFCLIFTAVTGYMMLGLSYKSYFPDILILEEDSKGEYELFIIQLEPL